MSNNASSNSALNRDFVRQVVDLVNAGARIIQIRSFERKRVRALVGIIPFLVQRHAFQGVAKCYG